MSVTLAAPEDLAHVAARIREGDAAAETELVEQFSDRVRVFIAMRTRDRELARDLSQEVMIHVLTALRRGQLREAERVGAFVFGVARNVVSNHFRGVQHEQFDPLPPELPAATANPEDEFEAARRQAVVNRALTALNRSDKGILLMTLVDGLKPGEIAYRLGLTAEVVRARKSRALKKVIDRVSSLSRMRI